LIAALAAVVGLLIATSDGGSGKPAGSVQGAGLALQPASIPPEGDTCSEPLSIAVDGTAAPLTCAGGKLNVVAWQHYARVRRFIMTLGPNADPEDAGRALCSDLDRVETTIPMEADAYRLAAVYYGWNFSLDPLDFFPDNCS
jgi:hypothetical protein